ncbi:MAG: hypothetical protein GMKNLPBB_03048 [Myxococcota bacterium]|nr:hypothetical protein [Myxococcota bacterium]
MTRSGGSEYTVRGGEKKAARANAGGVRYIAEKQ